ncbi:methyl-CpG-binding domain-containing protein 2-like [Zingiber officinale]|uniref:methyl-CpG-binding domain-containing protein 2-like n=1 Tax=Zingiber officinale TaxID=94328 RepID=UPI001C4D476E|nr:methyl-CpG-binding domain-containing protein 2-like [Zingiber officinale]
MSHLGAVSPKFKKKQARSSQKLTTKLHNSLEDPNTNDSEDDLPVDNASKQLVLHNEASSNPGQGATDLIESYPRSSQSSVASSASNHSSRVVPYVGHFTVQCSECLKWRLIPTKEKYEEIREKISEFPFLCTRAREWRPDISCDDPADIYQDGSKLWAIDKPDISQAPPGWERLLRIRGEGGSRFADIYYVTPSGKKLRSMVEVERYLQAQPEHARDGVNISQFSFLIPRPLQDNYVRKPSATRNMNKPTPLEPYEDRPKQN